MNKYLEHMLYKAREAHRLTKSGNYVICPFCEADEAEKFHIYGDDSGPQCFNCPLTVFFKEMTPDSADTISIEDLMDDCIGIGKAILEAWENGEQI